MNHCGDALSLNIALQFAELTSVRDSDGANKFKK